MIRNLKNDDDLIGSMQISRSHVKNNTIHVKSRVPLIVISCIALCCIFSVTVNLIFNNSVKNTEIADSSEQITQKKIIPQVPLPPASTASSNISKPAKEAVAKLVKEEQASRADNVPVERSPDGSTPRSRVTDKSVLNIISGQVEGKSVASADNFGKGGFAADIDAILSGVGGLKTGGSGRAERKSVAGIGYGGGYGSGFGGRGTGDIDEITGSLANQKNGLKKQSSPGKLIQTWKRSGLSANTSKLSVGTNDSLPLKGVQIAVTIDGFRARVVMDCFYQNTFSRQLEGTFKLRLPHEASPYYFAFGETVLMDKDGEGIPFQEYKNSSISLTPEDIKYRRKTSWNNVKEARIVPREKASYAYTETTRRSVDPAIMEWAGADIFNCRVFPLQPGKLHRIVIGYDLDLHTVGDDKMLTVAVPSAQGPVWIDIDMADLENCSPVLKPSKKLFK